MEALATTQVFVKSIETYNNHSKFLDGATTDLDTRLDNFKIPVTSDIERDQIIARELALPLESSQKIKIWGGHKDPSGAISVSGAS
jgi:hypothetical protein